MATLTSMDGPDSFGKFADALQANGIDLSTGEYTVLAPADSAFATFSQPITADLLKYHVIPGNKPISALTTDQTTLQGGTLAADRRFRKNWLNDVAIGQMKSDVACSNGVIHAIDTILVPSGGADAAPPVPVGDAQSAEAKAKAA